MIPLHEELKARREAKNITLDAVAEHTKIRTELLERLEAGDYSVAPEPYLRAFLREIGEYIGVDPASVIAVYEKKSDTLIEIGSKNKEEENTAETPPEVSSQDTDPESQEEPESDENESPDETIEETEPSGAEDAEEVEEADEEPVDTESDEPDEYAENGAETDEPESDESTAETEADVDSESEDNTEEDSDEKDESETLKEDEDDGDETPDNDETVPGNPLEDELTHEHGTDDSEKQYEKQAENDTAGDNEEPDAPIEDDSSDTETDSSKIGRQGNLFDKKVDDTWEKGITVPPVESKKTQAEPEITQRKDSISAGPAMHSSEQRKRLQIDDPDSGGNALFYLFLVILIIAASVIVWMNNSGM